MNVISASEIASEFSGLKRCGSCRSEFGIHVVDAVDWDGVVLHEPGCSSLSSSRPRLKSVDGGSSRPQIGEAS